MYKLIIVEGLTGLGKSTLASMIARQLRYNGFNAIWIHEGEMPHPISIEYDGDIAAYRTQSLAKWKQLVEKVVSEEVVTVIEASFFNNLIETLFTHGQNELEITGFFQQLVDIVEHADPCIVYLTHPDTSAALAENFANRGPGFQQFVIDYITSKPISQSNGWVGYDGTVAFWRAFVAITDTLFEAIEFSKVRLNVATTERQTIDRLVLDFLGVTWGADPVVPKAVAERLIGTYHIEQHNYTFTVRVENGAIITDMFMDVDSKLIPKSGLLFHTDKWHFTVQFFENDQQMITSLKIGGRDIDYLSMAGLEAIKLSKQ